MNLMQALRVLRARYKAALLVALATIALGFAVAVLLPKKYTAVTSVIVDVRSPDPVTALVAPVSVATQVDIISSQRVSRNVVRNLRLASNPVVNSQWLDATGGNGTIEDWLAVVLLKGLTVTPSHDSNIVTISYSATEPVFAAAVVNAFAQAYIDLSVELKVDPAKQYARWYGEQGKDARDRLEKAQAALSAYQQQKGIVTTDEQLDAELAKLNALSAELVRVQALTGDARSRQKAGGAMLPEVTGSSVIANLRAEIARAEARVQQASTYLGKNHPQYIRMQSELEALKSQLTTETRLITGGFSATSNVGVNKEAELTAAIAAQKKKLLAIRSERDQLAVLQRDVSAAKETYDAVTRRYNESGLSSKDTQANVSILTPAVVPLEASFPKPMEKTALILALAGILAGLGAALGLEMIDRRIRSSDDLAEALPVPTLVTIKRLPPRRLLLPSRPAVRRLT
jgi:succinoglycan biosynthesis transport protein ExoP